MARAEGDREHRDRQVRRVLLIEGAVNVAILGLKTVAAVTTGSIAIWGDALHSLTDVANNGVAWAIVRLSAAPPDERHPYGHRKFETIAVFGLAMLLVILGLELALGALRRESPTVAASGFALVVMLTVFATNIALASWQSWKARRLESDILRADARHTLADVLTTGVVIAGWQAAAAGYAWLDSAAALSVAGLIFALAYDLFRRSIPSLVDEASLEADSLVETILQVPGILGVRRVRSRGYRTNATVDVVVAVSGESTTIESHEIATAVEHALRSTFPVEHVIVHVEPSEEARGDSSPPGGLP